MSDLRNNPQPRLTLHRFPRFQDYRLRHVGYRRALKHARWYSFTLTVTEVMAGTIITMMLAVLGTFDNSAEMWEFGLGVLAVDEMPVWHWWYLAVILPSLALLNYLFLSALTLVGVWLFNTAAALSGGVLLRFEILDDPR